MKLYTLVVAMLNVLHPGAARQADPGVVEAIASSDATEEEAAFLTTYAWLESSAQRNPRPMSWDAKAGKSCGPWQEPCAFVNHATLKQQAAYWLRELRTVGLVPLDSSESRAAHRSDIARHALAVARVVAQSPHE